MASVKSEGKRLNNSIESVKLLLQSLDDNKKLSLQDINSPYLDQSNLKKRLLGEGDGKSVNTDFMSSLMDTLLQASGGGPDEAKRFIKKIIKKISNDSPKITKIIIEELFRSINCETDFSLSGIEIKFSPEEIDFFDILRTDPDSVAGSLMYEKRDTDVTDFPFPTNKFIYERTVNTTPTVYSSSDGLDLFTLSFDQFNQEYTLVFEDITVTDFVAYYYSSFELFNTKDLMSDIMDSLFGAFSYEVSSKRVKSMAQMNRMMSFIASLCGNFYEQDSLIKESLIDRLSTEDEDLSFEFDDEDIRYIEEEFNLRINKLYKLVDCGNFEAEMNPDLLVDSLLDLNSEELNETEVLESLLNGMGASLPDNGGFDIPTLNFNFNKDIFKQVPKAIVSKILSPKSVLPFIILTKAIDSAKSVSSDIVEFARNNNRFVTRVSSRVFDMYRQEIVDEIKKRLTALISDIIKEIAKQQLRGRYAIILTLINAINKLSKSDLSTCAGIIQSLLSLLNLKTGIPLGVPFPLLYGSYIREGANSTRAFNNTVSNLQKMGYNVGALPDGTVNKHVLAMDAQMKGLMKEIVENGAVQFVSQPGTGVHPLGPVAIPFITGKGVILGSY